MKHADSATDHPFRRRFWSHTVWPSLAAEATNAGEGLFSGHRPIIHPFHHHITSVAVY